MRGMRGSALALAVLIGSFGLAGAGGAAAADSPLLVGMGDSYTAGIGIPPTEPDSPLCERSLLAYPMLAAEQLGFDARSVACGGADLADFTQTSRRGSPPQTADIADADVIAFTVGGSDVHGPLGILFSGFSSVSAEEFAAEIAALTPQLVDTYTAVRLAAPAARVFVLGYPDVLPTTQAGLDTCLFPVGAALDAVTVHSNMRLLNAAIADAAVAAGVVFVDTAASFAGHEMCTATPYANTADSTDPATPGPGMHPNSLGHQVLAADLVAAIGTPRPPPPPPLPYHSGQPVGGAPASGPTGTEPALPGPAAPPGGDPAAGSTAPAPPPALSVPGGGPGPVQGQAAPAVLDSGAGLAPAAAVSGGGPMGPFVSAIAVVCVVGLLGLLGVLVRLRRAPGLPR